MKDNITTFLSTQLSTTEINYQSLFFKKVFEINPELKMVINDKSILDKYDEYMNRFVSHITFKEKEFLKYKYNPKRLSKTLYGTTEYWNLLLHINNMMSVLDFTNPNVKIFSKQSLSSIVSEILNIENEYILDNKNEIHEQTTIHKN